MTTQEIIMQSALELFSRKGYADATINEIAEKAGVNNLTIFRHFSDKESLFIAVVRHYQELSFDFSAMDALLTYNDLYDDIALIAVEYFKTVFSNIHILRIFIGESVHFDSIKKDAWFVPPGLVQHFMAYLEHLDISGPAAAEHTDLLAEMFVSHVTRRALEYNKHQSIWELSDALVDDFVTKMQDQISCLLAIIGAHRFV